MNVLLFFFGTGSNLNYLQMCSRAIVICVITLILVRIAGRRTFGLHAPFDNIIILLLGSILARAVVGASPFGPTVLAASAIVILHRFLARYCVRNHIFATWVKGSKIELFHNGTFNERNLLYCGVSKDDIREEFRLKRGLTAFDAINTIYMERNGLISFVDK